MAFNAMSEGPFWGPPISLSSGAYPLLLSALLQQNETVVCPTGGNTCKPTQVLAAATELQAPSIVIHGKIC